MMTLGQDKTSLQSYEAMLTLMLMIYLMIVNSINGTR